MAKGGYPEISSSNFPWKTFNILFQYVSDHTPTSLSANIRIVKWLPQNDLLAHKEIRAFVSHAGHNSLFESGYHGVPMVAIPLFADQFVNAKKAVDFGLALSLNLETLSSKLLKETIEQVVYEPR